VVVPVVPVVAAAAQAESALSQSADECMARATVSGMEPKPAQWQLVSSQQLLLQRLLRRLLRLLQPSDITAVSRGLQLHPAVESSSRQLCCCYLRGTCITILKLKLNAREKIPWVLNCFSINFPSPAGSNCPFLCPFLCHCIYGVNEHKKGHKKDNLNRPDSESYLQSTLVTNLRILKLIFV
jgi:hypothetical protein